MRSIFVERAAMAWTHEQPRFLKPSNRAPEVGTIDRENLERFRIDPAHPARHFGGVSVPLLADRVGIDGQSSLAFWKLGQRAKRNPTVLRSTSEARHDISQKGHTDERSGNAVQSGSDLKKKVAARHRPRGCTFHGGSF